MFGWSCINFSVDENFEGGEFYATATEKDEFEQA